MRREPMRHTPRIVPNPAGQTAVSYDASRDHAGRRGAGPAAGGLPHRDEDSLGVVHPLTATRMSHPSVHPASDRASVPPRPAGQQPALLQALALPSGVERDVVLPAALTDDAWQALVAVLRTTFGASGTVSQHDGAHVWVHGKTRVAVERRDGRAVLRLAVRRPDDWLGPALGALCLFLAAGATQVATGALLKALAALVPVVLALMCFGLPWMRVPKWVSAQHARFDQVAQEAMRLASSRAASPHGDR